MRITAGHIALLASVIAGACESADEAVSPGPDDATLPIFERPFDGRFPNTWPFDHDLPLGVFTRTDSGASGSHHVLTWRGDTVVMGWGDGRHHDGHDWAMPEGTPLLAVADGEVVFAGPETPFDCGALGTVAALIVGIEHRALPGGTDVYESRYVHLSRIDVGVGERVEAGRQIGLAGATGCASGPHLHLGVYRHRPGGREVVVDPFGWEGDFPDPWALHSGARSVWLWKEGEAPEGDHYLSRF